MKLKFACPYVRYEPLSEQVADEINLTYIPDKNDYENLIEFCQTYSSKRVNVRWRDAAGIDLKAAGALSKLCPNVTYCLEDADISKALQLKVRGCRFYFYEGQPARSFKELAGLVGLGVTDVYVADDLCYCLKDVRDYCHERGVRVRVVLNIVACSLISPSDRTIFFWRPNDIDLAALYFDVAEFDCGNLETYDFKKMKALYRIYFEDRSWVGNLQEIIPDLPFEVYNKSLVDEFNSRKVNCRCRCVSANSPCRKCQQFLDIADSLGKSDLAFRQGRVKRHEDDD